ncbi:hypothetical protein DI333_06185 [Salmonella enterica subsp. enterica serovar Oranienburg]|uniref:Polymer-forming cytoskeletal protein n=1 Tax=Salmonella enterica subsp. enterica serovar Macclesfield str. S-1643 TaxID=1242107 RepID=A0A241PXF3_SALET|nr:polymer-forming cytoskeletal protein [Salmonella enterica]EAA5488526.1 polymer-forming cytoskeletal protein [Salmonella enterica subsp. enterica serovar Kouka]EBG2396365.1 polymer-forming cytoskeletal protein [Salmonella enterica subsp. enterica serovar Everleigh]EEA5813290.1 hypothetical protein [Salmonella enterica subsp. enterica serovar Oranienburg]ASG19099.1 hypothetical protein LFZ25_24910 [Salmonella enterica subsp. enterica serovar Macclesfield str. S-1643]ECD5051717.1 polymer-formi
MVVWGIAAVLRAHGGSIAFFFDSFFLTSFFWSEIRRNMFGKKSSSVQEESTSAHDVEGSLNGELDIATTVIGGGTVVEGNILRGMNADVYGEFTGDINLPLGMVRVMGGGKVKGTILASGIVLGGEVEGCCEGKSVTVLAQGILRGTCRSAEFSIKPGGIFTGTSETLQENDVKPETSIGLTLTRVVDSGLSSILSTEPGAGSD